MVVAKQLKFPIIFSSVFLWESNRTHFSLLFLGRDRKGFPEIYRCLFFKTIERILKVSEYFGWRDHPFEQPAPGLHHNLMFNSAELVHWIVLAIFCTIWMKNKEKITLNAILMYVWPKKMLIDFFKCDIWMCVINIIIIRFEAHCGFNRFIWNIQTVSTLHGYKVYAKPPKKFHILLNYSNYTKKIFHKTHPKIAANIYWLQHFLFKKSKKKRKFN